MSIWLVEAYSNIVGRVSGAWDSLSGRQRPGIDSDIETSAAKLTQAERDRIYAEASGRTGLPGKSTYDWYAEKIKLDRTRKGMYQLYDEMDDEDTEVSTALDIYADNATEADAEEENVITIECEDPTAAAIMGEARKLLKLDSHIWGIARSLAKYGEVFEEIVVDEAMNMHRLKPLLGHTVARNEDQFGRLENTAFTQTDEAGQILAEFEEWQVVHFRLQKNRGDKYGTSILKSTRKTFKQLGVAEDAVLIARLTRANRRLKWKVDVEGLEPDEALRYIRDVKKEVKKKRVVSQMTGRLELEANPLSIEEDVFVGVRQGSPADVAVLGENTGVGDMHDVEYLQKKKYTGLKVPRAWMAQEQDVNAKATLTEQEVQFARTVRRITRSLQEGLRQVFDLALVLRGVSPATVDYTIMFPNMSTVDELRQWEIEALKAETIAVLKDVLKLGDEFMMRYYLGMEQDDIEEAIATQNPHLKLQDQLQSDLLKIQIKETATGTALSTMQTKATITNMAEVRKQKSEEIKALKGAQAARAKSLRESVQGLRMFRQMLMERTGDG